MLVIRKSLLTGETNSRYLDITDEQLRAWTQGELAQVAFPNLTAGEREFVISGITEQEWERFLGAEA